MSVVELPAGNLKPGEGQDPSQQLWGGTARLPAVVSPKPYGELPIITSRLLWAVLPSEEPP